MQRPALVADAFDVENAAEQALPDIVGNEFGDDFQALLPRNGLGELFRRAIRAGGDVGGLDQGVRA